MRYIYDPLIADKITDILNSEKELSSNKLRFEIKEKMKFEKDRMRKNRRDTDRNDHYIPSAAKISKTLEQLIAWQWIEKRHCPIGKLIKVFYGLTENGKFGSSINLKPHESYRLRDVYQWILRTATLGIYAQGWDKVKNVATGKIIVGTSIEDMLLEYDYNEMGNFNHRGFSIQELERGFEVAENEGAIEKKLIGIEIRYMINERLKRFVSTCWNGLYLITRTIVEKILILKRFPKKDTNYNNLIKWLVQLHGERFTKETVVICKNIRKKLKKKDKEKLFQGIKSSLAYVPNWKKQITEIYEKYNDKETSVKFNNLKESLLYYTFPKFVLDAATEALKEYSDKR